MSAAGALILQIRHQRIGHFGGPRQEVAARESLAFLDRLENQLLLLAAHALHAANASCLGGGREVIEARDAELLVEHGDGLGANALQPQHIEEGRRELGQ